MSLKTLREDLARQQSQEKLPNDVDFAVNQLIQRIDSHRPLRRDGNHHDHTVTCGCEDK